MLVEALEEPAARAGYEESRSEVHAERGHCLDLLVASQNLRAALFPQAHLPEENALADTRCRGKMTRS